MRDQLYRVRLIDSPKDDYGLGLELSQIELPGRKRHTATLAIESLTEHSALQRSFRHVVALPKTVRQKNKAALMGERITSYVNRSPPKSLGACYSHTFAFFQHAPFSVCQIHRSSERMLPIRLCRPGHHWPVTVSFWSLEPSHCAGWCVCLSTMIMP